MKLCMATDIELLGNNSTMSTSRRQRVVPKSSDAFHTCNVTYRFVLTLVISDWDITPPGDVFVKTGLKTRIQNAIAKVIDSMLDTGSSTDQEGSEEEEETHNHTYHSDSTDNAARPRNNMTRPAARRNCIPNMLFPLETYRLLSDRGWLPESHRSSVSYTNLTKII
jgi:hypothetical protein